MSQFQASNGHAPRQSTLRELAQQIPAASPAVHPEETLRLFEQALQSDQVFEQVFMRISPDHFCSRTETHLQALAAACRSARDLNDGRRPPIDLVRNEFNRIARGLTAVESPMMPGAFGQVSELFVRIESNSVQQLPVNVVLDFAKRLFVEREVFQPFCRLISDFERLHQQGSINPGSSSRHYLANLPSLLRQATDAQDEIEAAFGQGAETKLRFISDAEFATSNYPLEWLAEGVLVANQPAVVGGPSKSLKTSIMLDLAISLASPTPVSFLNRFPVAQRRVLFLSAESGERALQNCRQRIMAAKGLWPEWHCRLRRLNLRRRGGQ